MSKREAGEPTLTADYRHVPVTQAEKRTHRLGPLRESLSRFAGEVSVENLWCEIPLGNGWLVAYRLLPRAGHPADVGEVRIFPTEGNRPAPGEWSASFKGRRARRPRHRLTTRMLREVSVDRHRSVFASLIAKNDSAARQRAFFDVVAPRARVPAKTAGRPAKSRKVYAQYAVEYDQLENVERDGGRRSTRKRMAERHKVPESTVVGWLRTARKLGFLSPSAPGQRGSSATEAAFKALGRGRVDW